MNIIKSLWFWLTGQDILREFEHQVERRSTDVDNILRRLEDN